MGEKNQVIFWAVFWETLHPGIHNTLAVTLTPFTYPNIVTDPFMAAVFHDSSVLLLQGNVSCHTAETVQEQLEEHDKQFLRTQSGQASVRRPGQTSLIYGGPTLQHTGHAGLHRLMGQSCFDNTNRNNICQVALIDVFFFFFQIKVDDWTSLKQRCCRLDEDQATLKALPLQFQQIHFSFLAKNAMHPLLRTDRNAKPHRIKKSTVFSF